MADPAVEGLTAFEEIGRGGFGVVYRAHQEALGRDVAVKVLPGVGRDSQAFARFERECRALGSVGAHPNIATVHGCGVTAGGEGYLSMELLEGGSLADRLAAGPLPWIEVARIGVALSGALESAHRLGVLHRDVKPQNVLFDRLGAPKLLDFGIASVPGSYQTRTSGVSLTLAHAAPEITAGGRATVASDVYALGSTLWTAAAGSPPFVREGEDTLVPLLARIAAAPVPDLVSDGAPAALSALLAKALAKDPGARPASAEELGAGLAYVLRSAGEQVDGPAVLTPSPRGLGLAVADSPGPISEVSEQTVSRKALPAVALAVIAEPGSPAPSTASRRRQLAAASVAAILLLLFSGLTYVGLFGAPWDGGSATAAELPSNTPSHPASPRSSAKHSLPARSSSPASTAHSSATKAPPGPTGATGTLTREGTGAQTSPRDVGFSSHPTATVSPSGVGVSSSTTTSRSASTSSSTSSSTPPSSSSPSTSPTSSSPPPPPAPPGTPTAGAARMMRRDSSSIRLDLTWQPPTDGGAVTSYEVRRTRMHGSGASAAPVGVASGSRTTDRHVQVSAPLINDTQGWFRWEVRSRGLGGLSEWHVLRVNLRKLTGHNCTPSVLGMRAAGLQTTAVHKGNPTGKTSVVRRQSIAAGSRPEGRALVLTCTRT